ncbi:MAG: glycosyltransferase [Treponema sp.]|nr:glycosyltransferase [Treponema sp.]
MKVVIVHYWLVKMRGGEKMLEALLELFPQADIYTHVYDPKGVSPAIRGHKVISSWISRLPWAKRLYPLYMPLMPRALNSFDLQAYDLVISSEAGPAKGVVPRPNAFHLCYCHSPMRYIWDLYHQYAGAAHPLVRFFMGLYLPSLRAWDILSANMVDKFVTNSSYVARRIRRIYQREAEVVYGPVDIERYMAAERAPGDYYLLFGEITPYKKAPLAIEACIKSGRKLVVAGSGMKKKEKRKYEKSGLVEFLGPVSDERAIELFSQARALLYPGIEDLGLVPIEANAAGCPVIAYKDGGVLDTIAEYQTGLFFTEQTTQSLIDALERFEAALASGVFQDRQIFTDQVQQFSKQNFQTRILQALPFSPT